jgi:hypothetical protein
MTSKHQKHALFILLILALAACSAPLNAKPAQPNYLSTPAVAHTPRAGAPPQQAANAPSSASTENFSLILGRPETTSIAAGLLSTEDAQVMLAFGTQSGLYDRQSGPVSLRAGLPQTIALSGLSSDTTYYYRITAGGKPGDEHHFHTQRPPGSSFTFTMDADPHNRDPRFDGSLYRAVLANALNDNPDFHINLGDTFMTEKAHPSNYAGVAATFAEMHPYLGILAADAPLFLANGNHEGELGWLYGKDDQSDLPAWAAELRQAYYPGPQPDGFYSGAALADPALNAPRDGYFAWTWGDALFVVLDPFWYTVQKPRPDDSTGGWNWTLGKDQYDWLKSTLESSPARFKFVFIHHLVGGGEEARGGVEVAGFYEWGGKNADGSDGFAQHRPGWSQPVHQILVDNHVNAVFHGHDHVYVRQTLDGIIYQELPQSTNNAADNTRLAADYGYVQGQVRPGSGYLRVTVTPTLVSIAFVRVALSANLPTIQIEDQYQLPYR